MKYAKTRVCVFSGSGPSLGPGSNLKAVFFFKCFINTTTNSLKLFIGAFRPKKCVPKNEFFIIFSKSDYGEGGGHIL